jgi:hypothetical protein
MLFIKTSFMLFLTLAGMMDNDRTHVYRQSHEVVINGHCAV